MLFRHISDTFQAHFRLFSGTFQAPFRRGFEKGSKFRHFSDTASHSSDTLFRHPSHSIAMLVACTRKVLSAEENADPFSTHMTLLLLLLTLGPPKGGKTHKHELPAFGQFGAEQSLPAISAQQAAHLIACLRCVQSVPRGGVYRDV